MRTTITLDEDVARTVREEMRAGNGKTFKDAVNELIRRGRYSGDDSSPTKKKPFRVRAKRMGTFVHINYDKTSDLLHRLDIEEFERKSR